MLKSFYTKLQLENKVINTYEHIIANIKSNSGYTFYSPYTYQRFCNKQLLIDKLNKIGLKDDPKSYTRSSILNYLQEQLTSNVSSFYCEIADKLPVDTIQQIHCNPIAFVDSLMQDLTAYNLFSNYQTQMSKLTEKCLNECNINWKRPVFYQVDTLIQEVSMVLPEEKNYYVLAEIAKRLSEVSYTLHEILGTKLIIFDTETTDTKTARPIQIAYIKCDLHLNPIQVKNLFIYQSNISPEAIRIHGMNQEFLREHGATSPEDAINQIDYEINNSKNILVGHNISFDIRAYNALRAQAKLQSIEPLTFCTYANSAMLKQVTSNLPNKKQSTILDVTEDKSYLKKMLLKFTPDTLKTHDARYDVCALYTILKNNNELFLNE